MTCAARADAVLRRQLSRLEREAFAAMCAGEPGPRTAAMGPAAGTQRALRASRSDLSISSSDRDKRFCEFSLLSHIQDDLITCILHSSKTSAEAHAVELFQQASSA